MPNLCRVLVKKLGHDWELELLDRTLCQLAEEPGSCQVNGKLKPCRNMKDR